MPRHLRSQSTIIMKLNQPVDPKDPGSFTRKSFVVSSGHRYSYIDQSLDVHHSGEVVLLLHGFPDLAYGWRYQISDLVSRGYRTIAPDLLGYGGTSKPTDVNSYSKLKSCRALLELLGHENILQKVIIVGHDWGSALTFRFVQYFPEKVKCWITCALGPSRLVLSSYTHMGLFLVSSVTDQDETNPSIHRLCVPPSRPGQPGESTPDFEKMVHERLPHLGYQLYFMSDRFSEEIHRYRRTLILLLYLHTDRGLESSIKDKFARLKDRSFVGQHILQNQIEEVGDQLEHIEVKEPEISYFLSEFEKGGLLGPLSWYKTREIDQSDEQAACLPPSYPAEIPCLFVGASKDPAFPPHRFTDQAKAKLFPAANLTTRIIRGGNHFMHQDPVFRDRVTEVIGTWIDSRTKLLRNRSGSHL